MENVCEFCDKTFSTKYTLNTHIKTSKTCISLRKASLTETQKHSCKYCFKEFSRIHHLQNHANVCPKKIEFEKEIKQNENKKLKELCEQLKTENISLKNQVSVLTTNLDKSERKYDDLFKSYENITNKNMQLSVDLSNKENFIKGCETTERPTQVINNINNINNNNCNIKIKLSKIEIKNSTPLTIEFIRKKTENDYLYDNFILGIGALNKFVESVVVFNPNELTDELKLCPYKAGLNYVCTDKTNHEFYRLNDSKEWEPDQNAKCINTILDELKPIVRKHCNTLAQKRSKLEKQYCNVFAEDLNDKINPIHTGILKEGNRPTLFKEIRDTLAEKIYIK